MIRETDYVNFRNTVNGFYKTHKRILPWRQTDDPYKILVSEFMLQQTQVERVLPKYLEFTERIPGFSELARSDLRLVLELWQGLGYNRRAKNLKACAEIVADRYNCILPETFEELIELPGIGNYTASALIAFVFNKPVPVIDTNIRRVFIYSFFPDMIEIHDREIIPLVEKTMDTRNPREWFYALMDYGSFLGKAEKGINHKSRHYKKQSVFEGSDRQIRGEIIRQLLASGELAPENISGRSGYELERINDALRGLVREGMIAETNGIYRIE